MTAVRVVVADDQPAMRAALRTILEADGIRVVGEAGDGARAVAVALELAPDAVLMDLRMPGRDGLSATEELARRLPRVPILVLTTFDDDESLFGSLRSGASGFLLKNAAPEELQRAVRRVAAGDAVIDASVLARVMRRAASTGGELRRWSPDGPARLTEREKDVWWLVAQGLTNAEVAARLTVGEATAKTHVSNVITKLGVRDRVQAAIRAHETGFAVLARMVGPPRRS